MIQETEYDEETNIQWWDILLLVVFILTLLGIVIFCVMAVWGYFSPSTSPSSIQVPTTSTGGGAHRENNFSCGASGIVCDVLGGQVCREGKCVCFSTGSTYCSSGGLGCRNLKLDPTNCGACGQACQGVAGCCNGSCVNFSETGSCGSCGTICTGPNPGCCGGECVTNLLTNNLSCGSCFTVCTTGFKCCGGTCTGIMSDSKNCGGCGIQCLGVTHCESGACVTGCATGLYNCGNNSCSTLLDDNANCGVCGNNCPSGTFCLGGTCVPNTCQKDSNTEFCPNGYCNGLNQVTSCGYCGNECKLICHENRCTCNTNQDCNAGFACIHNTNGGLCQPPNCPSGTTFCPLSTSCIDLNFSALNCGICGNICESGSCVNGRCTCSSDSQCALGYICVGGECVLR
jgi:hypothetical protein